SRCASRPDRTWCSCTATSTPRSRRRSWPRSSGFVGHVEAGLRSRDWSMPEEINRVVTDRLSDLLFTPSRDAGDTLLAEGIPRERVHFVGNIMIDSLVALLPEAGRRNGAGPAGAAGAAAGPYVVVTLHRPANVDDAATLRQLLDALA